MFSGLFGKRVNGLRYFVLLCEIAVGISGFYSRPFAYEEDYYR